MAPLFNAKPREMNVWWGFYFRLLDKQSGFHDDKEKIRIYNCICHVSFLFNPEELALKKRRFVVLSQFLQSGGRVSKV